MEPAGEGGARDDSRRARLLELARLFLRLGVVSFGGPAVHVALMEEEVVRRLKWLTPEEFLDLMGAANLIPGPNSTELAIHIGYRRAGTAGLVLSGACFILPAALITAGFAWAYTRFRYVPAVGALLYGLKPAILGVVAAAIVRLARTALKNEGKRWFSAIVGVSAMGASLAGGDELAVLFGAGALGLVRATAKGSGGAKGATKGDERAAGFSPLIAQVGATGAACAAGAAGAAGAKGSLLALALYFLKVGSLLYGGGYVLVSFLRGDLVVERGWITERELLDAVAIGQATPGPVFSTATFIGYLLHGPAGAALATAAIFLPSFVLVRATSPFVQRMRASIALGGFLDGVNAGAIGLMGAVLVTLAGGALVGWPAWVIGVLGVAAALIPKLNPTWVLLGGAAAGLLVSVTRIAPIVP
jgi:chromate transporter